jgi:DNA-binding transcriptional ArsR family regulator
MEGFWPAPRSLRYLLEDGEVTPTAYALLHYLAEAGADRPQGVAASYVQLARLLGVGEKTISRALGALRDRGLIGFDLRQGQRKPFRVHLGPNLRPGSREPMSEQRSDVASDVGVQHDRRDPDRTRGAGTDGTSDSGTACPAPTKTKTKETGPAPLALAFDAYLAAGGSLELGEWRGALARQATSLLRNGVDPVVVRAAAAALGRERAFPGYLKQRAESLQAAGGPCTWEGLIGRG